jgi:FkbM family methyltransferase
VSHYQALISPRGRTGVLSVRDGTSDLSIAFSTFHDRWTQSDDEYGLRDLDFVGWVLDVGAHVGTVGIAILLDNPEAKVIFVEPVPENAELIRSSLRANELQGEVIEASVGTDTIVLGTTADDRWVGNLGHNDGAVLTVPTVTLTELVERCGGHVAALKTDCEGGEWQLLDSPAVAACDYIFGEWHGDGHKFNGPARLTAMLEGTHEVTILSDDGGVGLFRAVRR